MIGRFMGREGEGNLCGTEGKKEIENNDRYMYKFASRPIYSLVRSLYSFSGIYIGLIWPG